MIVFFWYMYVCWTSDVTLDLIEYLTGHILYYVLSILLFIYFIHVISYSHIYFLYLLTCYMHMHFPVYSYTFTKSSDSLDLHIQICDYLLLIRFLERITSILRSQSSLLLDHLFSVFSVSFLFHCFHDFMNWTHAYSIFFSYVIMCGCLYVTL